MKKFLGILALLILVVSVFVLAPNRAGASKNIFDKGTQDELERAKQISLDILRDSAVQRPIGIVDEFKVEKVEIDDLNMAHTRVQQIVSDIPVWEGEAIVHLKADGELSAITDDLKEGVSVNTQANFSAKQAVEIAKSMYKDSESLTEEPTVDLWIYRGKNRDHLAYPLVSTQVL